LCTREHAEFGFGHVEPTAVFGRVVPFETFDEPARLGGGEGFVKALSCTSAIFAASGKCTSDKFLSV
jgi:hypothetical protein